jgi:hypothetical protein
MGILLCLDIFIIKFGQTFHRRVKLTGSGLGTGIFNGRGGITGGGICEGFSVKYGQMF